MESKEAELMRSRKEKQTFSWWSLSFEEGAWAEKRQVDRRREGQGMAPRAAPATD